MPPVSKAQARFMRASAAGSVVGPAPSKSVAKERTSRRYNVDLERSGKQLQRKRQMGKGKGCK